MMISRVRMILYEESFGKDMRYTPMLVSLKRTTFRFVYVILIVLKVIFFLAN